MGCEPLENRTLLTATLDANGALKITGTSGADLIGLRVELTSLRVDMTTSFRKFALANVKSISVDLGEGNDQLYVGVGVGPFYCLGGLGDDTIVGGDAADTITAGGGRDSVNGGAGDDRIDGGPTADRIDGGDGADRLYGSDANDNISGGAGVDRLFGGLGNDVLVGGSSNDKLYGDAGNDTLAGNNQNDLLTGGAGDDVVVGGDGDDTLNGQDGDDLLQGQLGNDTAFGDAGFDTLADGAGNDWLTGGDDDDSVTGSDGNDTLRGNAGDDWLDGGNNTDALDGGDGADSLSGGAGRDQLVGGVGNDALLGGRDEDTLTGGDGTDRFLSRIKDTASDRTAVDALLNFSDGNLLWTDEEIWKVDVGLEWLQQRTGGVKILKLSSGKDITVERNNDVGIDVLGDNRGDGIIDIADLTFTSATISPAAVMIHEIAHNWDTQDENPTLRDFFELSRWRERFGNWTYDPDAEFAREYGTTNPYEDFATAVEVYYSHYTPASQWQAKWNFIDNWLNTMH